jgi:hypothetical protein
MDDPTVNIVAGITSPPASVSIGAGEQTITVTFKSNVKDMVPSNGDSLTVKLYASYKPAETPDVTKYAYLEIRVEDGTCICPVKKSATEWLNFMCHNLGGLDIISSSQLITRAYHGDWYRYGASQVSMRNTPDNDESTAWDNATYQSDYSNWTNDPYPAGWQLPTFTELVSCQSNIVG